MNFEEKALVRMRFKAVAATLSGMAYQNIFTQVMTYARPDFAPVKPQGAEGDWKNDGHEPKAGRYYQVYSPEVYSEGAAIKKIKADFSGLWSKWSDKKVYPTGINEFYFVVNDAYRITPGAYPTTYSTLAGLKVKYSLDECKPFLTKDLEDELLELADDQIFTIVGFIPNPASIRTLRMDLLNEIVGHIISNPIARSLKQSLADPDFEEKITFNRLNYAATWLRAADFRRGTVEQFFIANSSFSRQAVRDKLNAIYIKSQEQGFRDIPDGPSSEDQQFEFILREITPTSGDGSDKRSEKDIEDAALVLMAYFFDACDIFEEPPKC